MIKKVFSILGILLLFASCSFDSHGPENPYKNKANIKVSYSGSKLLIDTDENTKHNMFIKFSNENSQYMDSILDLENEYVLRFDPYEDSYRLYDHGNVVILEKSKHYEIDLSALNFTITGVSTDYYDDVHKYNSTTTIITHYLTINISVTNA